MMWRQAFQWDVPPEIRLRSYDRLRLRPEGRELLHAEVPMSGDTIDLVDQYDDFLVVRADVLPGPPAAALYIIPGLNVSINKRLNLYLPKGWERYFEKVTE